MTHKTNTTSEILQTWHNHTTHWHHLSRNNDAWSKQWLWSISNSRRWSEENCTIINSSLVLYFQQRNSNELQFFLESFSLPNNSAIKMFISIQQYLVVLLALVFWYSVVLNKKNLNFKFTNKVKKISTWLRPILT